MGEIVIDTPRVFLPLLGSKRYKDAVGGRASGKSHFFAELMIEEALSAPGYRAVCIREVMKDLSESAKLLLEDKIKKLGVGQAFDCQRDKIVTPGGGIIIFRGMRDFNAESIKSLEGFDRAWVEEAQTLSPRSLELLRPTIRKEGSEIWFSRNRRRKADAVDVFVSKAAAADDANVASVLANWRDNPFWGAVLEDERQRDLRDNAESYGHVWEGEYISQVKGAYFAEGLARAKAEGRYGKVAADPLLQVRAYADIGGTSGKSDAFAFWVVQFVGREIRVLDHYEAIGQEFGEHVHWLRSRGYERALIKLPHDGLKHDMVYRVTPESYFRDAGFMVDTMPNAGAGAASARIEAVRRILPQVWFNEATTEAGREALGWYHERRDAERNVGLGPDHDWSSHSADAFGQMAMDYEAPRAGGPAKIVRRSTSWVV